MKVIFLIPLRSSRTTSNWELVCKYLSYTVKSIQNQSNQNFKILIIANEKPLYIDENERLIVISKDYALPKSYGEMLHDIRLKIFDGLLYAKQYGPCYIMRMDGDDLLNRDFVKKVILSEGRGYYFYLGYDYSIMSKSLMVRPRFFMHCGSAHVIYLNHGDFPSPGDRFDSGRWFIDIWKHQSIDKHYYSYFKKQLPIYPGLAVMRLINTGENIEYNRESVFKGFKYLVWRLFFSRKMKPAIINQFSVPKEYVS